MFLRSHTEGADQEYRRGIGRAWVNPSKKLGGEEGIENDKGKGQNTLWGRGAEPSGWNGMFLIDHHTVEAECTRCLFYLGYDVFHKERYPQWVLTNSRQGELTAV